MTQSQPANTNSNSSRRRFLLQALGLSAAGLVTGGGAAWAMEHLEVGPVSQANASNLQTQLEAAQAAQAQGQGQPMPGQGQSQQPDFKVDQLLTLIRPAEGEDPFSTIPWQTKLWDARKLAAKEGKPILLWEMDGHPLGCG